jgi:hypothetical protein
MLHGRGQKRHFSTAKFTKNFRKVRKGNNVSDINFVTFAGSLRPLRLNKDQGACRIDSGRFFPGYPGMFFGAPVNVLQTPVNIIRMHVNDRPDVRRGKYSLRQQRSYARRLVHP